LGLGLARGAPGASAAVEVLAGVVVLVGEVVEMLDAPVDAGTGVEELRAADGLWAGCELPQPNSTASGASSPRDLQRRLTFPA
jgi:hypothetical protein